MTLLITNISINESNDTKIMTRHNNQQATTARQ